MKRVVFVCIENSNRSQMAEAFAQMRGGIEAFSAGSRPSGKVNPKAVAASRHRRLRFRPALNNRLRYSSSSMQ